jgi:hypothetical protein
MKRASSIIVLGLLSFPFAVHGQNATVNPLAGFEQLVGGAWHLDGSYQVFEWGLERRIVRATSYVVTGSDTSQVAEGMWFWHPGDRTVRGIVTAINMPVEFFDYTTRFEGKALIHDLTSYGNMGDTYVERWELTDEDHDEWTLFRMDDGELERLMGGTFERIAWAR